MQKLMKNDRLLEAENLTLAFKQRTLLQDISFVLPQGKLTVLIGPNGAGKSTLMRLLSGYLQPTSGQCYLHGRPLPHYSASALANYRAVMKQHSQLNFPFSALEIIKMGGYSRPAQAVENDLEKVMAETACQSLCHKPYNQLSGGEQQRVQLARALLQLWHQDMRGKLLFLDEPISAFDLYHQQHCLRLMSKLCQQQGLTVCCILHDLNLAALYGDHILLLAESRLQAEGSAKQVITTELIKRYYHADIEQFCHHQLDKPQIGFNH